MILALVGVSLREPRREKVRSMYESNPIDPAHGLARCTQKKFILNLAQPHAILKPKARKDLDQMELTSLLAEQALEDSLEERENEASLPPGARTSRRRQRDVQSPTLDLNVR